MSTKNTRRRGRPAIDSERIDIRFERGELDALDAVATLNNIGRPDAVRFIVSEWLIEQDLLRFSLSRLNRRPVEKLPPPLTEEEDQKINRYYASGAPGVGSHFFSSILNHLHKHYKQNPDITVEEVKEFVLDVFDDYGQPLD